MKVVQTIYSVATINKSGQRTSRVGYFIEILNIHMSQAKDKDEGRRTTIAGLVRVMSDCIWVKKKRDIFSNCLATNYSFLNKHQFDVQKTCRII